ncbi:MAG: hypothetical protein DWQ01_18125 [Planctomycetota bacterium]|nr:MAG: hypothetical protein DWQ01_18125 [Planctomycetota bacterium]
MKLFDGAGLTATIALTATAVVSMTPEDVELQYTLDPDTMAEYDFGEEGFALLSEGLEQLFGPHGSPQLPEGTDLESLGLSVESLQRGRISFVEKCLHCHGTTGGGDGPTAIFLNPLPRNFRHGTIKFTSTVRSSPPTRNDIELTLRRGVAYTAMPSFATLTDQELDDLVDYVQFLMMRGETERVTAFVLDDEGLLEDEELDREEMMEEVLSFMQDEFDLVASKWLEAEDNIVLPSVERPEPTAESIARGKELFLSARTECSACHGNEGQGKGPNVYDAEKDEFYTKDNWGNVVAPADLTKGFYRGGERPLDLFRRIHQGIKGTPMPQFSGNLTDEQIWDLVNFLYSIRFNNAQ